MTGKSKDAQLDQLTDSALKIIMEASPVGIIVFGSDARIIYANPLASKIFAKQATEISGLKCGDFIDCANRHKDFQGCGFSDSCANCPLFQAIYSSVSGGSKEVLKEGEAFLERDAGLSDIWVKYKVNGIEMDSRKILIMAVDDITDRKRAEDALRESEEKFRQMAENIQEVFWLRSSDNTKMFYINPVYEAIWGKSCQSLYENPDSFLDAVYEEDKQMVLNEFKQEVEGKKIFDLEYRIVGPDGKIRWVWVRSFPVRDEKGKILNFTGLAVDITDRKQAEKQLDWQFRLQRLLMEISSTFINIPIEKMEPTIDTSLGEMAEFVGADRSYIFHYDFEQETCTNLHEWCREGINSQINALNSVPLSIMPTLVNRHREGEPLYVQDVPSMKKDGFREHLESQKIKSLLTVPMMLNNECIGFAGFDWVRHHHVYSETERHLLMVFAQMLVNIHLRKQSEKKLRESEEKYRRITENISDVVWITDLNLNSIYFSPSTDRVFGEPVSSYMNKTLEERFPPESLKKILSILSEELEKENDPQCNKKRTRMIEVEHYRVDGSQFWVSMNVSFVRGENGIPIGIQGVTRDITDLKKSEEALRQSEAFIKSIMDNLPIGVAVNSVYPSPKFEYINDNFVKFYRTTKEALSEPGAFWDVVYEDPIFRKKIKNRVLEDCASGDPERMCWKDISITRKDEGTFFISSKNIPISDKNLMISTVWDVTERKQAEEALKSNYKLLRIAEKTAKFGGWSVDINKKRVLWSDEVANIHEMPRGYSPSVNEAILFYAPEFRDEMTKVFKDCAEKGIPYDKEMEIITAKGKRVWVRTTGEAVRDGNGKIIKVQGSFQDINEHKILERQLLQAQKMESVGRLAGGVAHDINNKMLVILGYAELVQETLRDSDPIYKFVEEIIAAGQKSTNIVGQLLAFARKQTISPKVCDLNAIVENMLKMIRRLISEDIELIWMPGVNKWPVKIDPAQIDQILVNLCVNARDAITKMGKITIETENVTIDEEYCSKNSGFLPGEYVMLAVNDNGEGMNKETLDNIFEPFFTTKPVGIGTGLGLATVYGIVKQNNGFINVYSETGEGTTFRIYLPRHSVEDREIQTENAVEITMGACYPDPDPEWIRQAAWNMMMARVCGEGTMAQRMAEYQDINLLFLKTWNCLAYQEPIYADQEPVTSEPEETNGDVLIIDGNSGNFKGSHYYSNFRTNVISGGSHQSTLAMATIADSHEIDAAIRLNFADATITGKFSGTLECRYDHIHHQNYLDPWGCQGTYTGDIVNGIMESYENDAGQTHYRFRGDVNIHLHMKGWVTRNVGQQQVYGEGTEDKHFVGRIDGGTNTGRFRIGYYELIHGAIPYSLYLTWDELDPLFSEYIR